MNVQNARSPSASRPWPPPAAARPGLMAPRSASLALHAASLGAGRAPWDRGAPGARLGYLCAAEAQRQSLSRRLTIACCPAHAERRRPSDCRWAHSAPSTECARQQSDGLRRSERRPGSMLWSAAATTIAFMRLRRRGSRACPARHGARPAPRLSGPSRPTLGPSALAGRRLAAATAGLRKASELFKHSCATYTHATRNQPLQGGLSAHTPSSTHT